MKVGRRWGVGIGIRGRIGVICGVAGIDMDRVGGRRCLGMGLRD